LLTIFKKIIIYALNLISRLIKPVRRDRPVTEFMAGKIKTTKIDIPASFTMAFGTVIRYKNMAFM